MSNPTPPDPLAEAVARVRENLCEMTLRCDWGDHTINPADILTLLASLDAQRADLAAIRERLARAEARDIQLMSDALATETVVMHDAQEDGPERYCFFLWGIESDNYLGATLAQAWHRFCEAHDMKKLRDYVKVAVHDAAARRPDTREGET